MAAETMVQRILRMINEELKFLYEEMRDLDRRYIECQKKVRELKKTKELIEKELMGQTNTQAIDKPTPPPIRSITEEINFTTTYPSNE